MGHLHYTLFFIIVLFGCKAGKPKRIVRFGEFAEGNIQIGKDTIFNGLIKYYDTITNELTSEIYYIRDTITGLRKDFHPNGHIASTSTYQMGDEHGLSSFFDSSGNLFLTTYYFHGVQVGPFTKFKKNKPIKYSFFSFDRYNLFELNYDSSIESTVKSWKNKLFFYTENFVVDDYNSENVKRIYFVYLPNPPEFEFKYSFCLLDSIDNVIRTIKNFSSEKPWTEYISDPNDKAKNQSFAFHVRVTRNGKEIFSDIKMLQ